MKNILVTGCNGQLGNEIQRIHSEYPYHFIFTDIHNLDITNREQLDKIFCDNTIDFIINCAAYTNVNKAESDIENCNLLNKTAPGLLAEFATKYKSFLIHVSTDYVFDGTNHKPYTESDATQPISVYGKSKLDGEIEIIYNAKRAVIIRTSWLYSSFGNNFVKTMLNVGLEKGELKVVYDQVGTPTYAGDLAKAILNIIPQTDKIKQVEIFNFSNEGVCSWYDFAKEIIDISQIKCSVFPVTSQAFPTPVKRPHYSVLSKEKIKQFFNLEIPYWKDSLKECLKKIPRNNLKK